MDLMIPRLEKFATEGLFGEINLLRVGPSTNNEKSAQFQPQMGFFEVDLVTRNGKVRKVPVVVKLQLEDLIPEHQQANFEQFANEVITYQEVLPSLGAKELGLYPTMYYGNATRGKDPKQDILILEDLRHQGFKVPKDVVLDPVHINLALRKLGEFHGLSYKLKLTSPEKFEQLKGILTTKPAIHGDAYAKTAILRAFEEDLQSSPAYSVLNKAYKKLNSKDSGELLQCLRVPEEPFAVVVHGDFLNNNVMYAYDENGKPCGVKFLNFAMAMYSDPTIDLSALLYMHTTEGREAYWNEHLKSYWDGVLSIGNPGFTFEEFSRNFAKKAVYGFIISCSLLPQMLHPEDPAVKDKHFAAKPDKEKRETSRTIGGEESTAAVRSIARHLHLEGYLEEYLLHFNQ